ncbi:prolipoprotein diacylglyceryl transferase [Candidatus Woesearchaeota archaeon]|nr:prolipoprotein diacylglyceryl transferase [Candidatus Woesearchaeota archaeon]
MYLHNLNPTLLNLGPLEIRWYGLVYVFGFLLGVYFLQKKRAHLNLSKEDVWDLIFYVMIGVIIGARLFELLWEPKYYLSNLGNIFKIWQGGMSFHGGFVGSVVGAWLYCKKKKRDFLPLADILVIPAVFALALGRIANFVNGELGGRAWNGSWCVNFKNKGGGDICRHPYVIYEAVKRFLIFAWLLWLSYKKKFKAGFIFWNFIFWEGCGRFILDFFREETLYFSLTVGQWLSFVMVGGALYSFHKYYKGEWEIVLKKRTSEE